jgi:hypothetical protein
MPNVTENLNACAYVTTIEKGGAAKKSPHKKFGYFLSISQQVVSAHITKNSAVAVFES